jgi:hypothetical protein
MIVYNAGRKFFALKAEAEAHRRELGLPKDRLLKIQIDDREQLAAFLDALAGGAAVAVPAGVILEGGQLEQLELADEAFAFIPDFMRRDWQRRAELRKSVNANQH